MGTDSGGGTGAGDFEDGGYWRRRSDMLYYRYVDYILRTVGRGAGRMIDVGSGNCPYLDWFDWIPERVSVDIRAPYSGPGVTAIRGDVLTLDLGPRFDICTCLQVLEHVPEPGPFLRRLLDLADLVVVSVPFRWPAGQTQGHLHDPVDDGKLAGWAGRAPNYRIVVQEPFGGPRGRRLIALYDRDPGRRFGPGMRKDRLIRQSQAGGGEG